MTGKQETNRIGEGLPTTERQSPGHFITGTTMDSGAPPINRLRQSISEISSPAGSYLD